MSTANLPPANASNLDYDRYASNNNSATLAGDATERTSLSSDTTSPHKSPLAELPEPTEELSKRNKILIVFSLCVSCAVAPPHICDDLPLIRL